MEVPDVAPRTPPRGTSLDASSTDRPRIPRTPPRTVVHVAPLDPDGVRTVGVITAMWGTALLGLLPFYAPLQAAGRDWWIWVCSAGLGIGLLALDHLRRRRDDAPADITAATPGAATTPARPAGRRRAR